jgi:hypothetical protein
MTLTDVFTLTIPLMTLLPGLYYLWLHLTKGYEYARKKLHTLTGDEYARTDAGAMAIDHENWIVYLYRE